MKLSYFTALTLLAVSAPLTALAQGSSPALTVAPIDTVVVTRGGKVPL